MAQAKAKVLVIVLVKIDCQLGIKGKVYTTWYALSFWRDGGAE